MVEVDADRHARAARRGQRRGGQRLAADGAVGADARGQQHGQLQPLGGGTIAAVDSSVYVVIAATARPRWSTPVPVASI